MKITVILCTYNRGETLANALSSAAGLIVPDSIDWDMLVIDNNSSDQTRDIVAEFSRRYPARFRYVFESRQGLCYARNTGVRQACGEIVAFMDDDVTVEPTWLQNLTSCLHDGDCVGAGGRILPDRMFSPPPWVPVHERYALAPLVMFDVGSEPGQLTEPPWGANMAFRKEVFTKHGYFRNDLGRRGNCLLGGEDTEFGRRLLEAGERLRYEPSAVVYHAISEKRLTKAYFLAWRFGRGRSLVREFGLRADAKYACMGVPLYLFRNLAVWSVRWMVAIEPGQRFSCKLNVWSKVGEIVECHRQSREKGMDIQGRDCRGPGSCLGTPRKRFERFMRIVAKLRGGRIRTETG
ncbi:MAG: glycosyltransferase family 2 protein [Bryobacteraceae bacterium]